MNQNKSKVTWNQILKARDGTKTTSFASAKACSWCSWSPSRSGWDSSRSWYPWRARENAAKVVQTKRNRIWKRFHNLQTYWSQVTPSSNLGQLHPLQSQQPDASWPQMTRGAKGSLIENQLHSERGIELGQTGRRIPLKHLKHLKHQTFETFETSNFHTATVPSAPRNHQEIAKKGNATWKKPEETLKSKKWWNMYKVQAEK